MGFHDARKKAGMTQEEVANALGVTPATVSMWETGRMQPRANMLPKIASLYGCTIEHLMAVKPEE